MVYNENVRATMQGMATYERVNGLAYKPKIKALLGLKHGRTTFSRPDKLSLI